MYLQKGDEPYCCFYAQDIQSADIFTKGAIDLLNLLKVDYLVFGSESNDIDKLYEVSKIQYNDVFHDEHIIPLEMIINELKEIKKPDINEDTYNQVRKILDKIYICKMLKSEDRDLLDSRKRKSTDVIEVVEYNYLQRTKSGNPIEIVDWENIKKQICLEEKCYLLI